MTFRWHSLVTLFLSASTVFAGWDGFPCPSNVSWYSVETNHYISQLYTALVERCKASGVSAPAVVDTYTNLFAGYTNTYTSTNGYIVTNNWICYTNVTVTNQFLPFAYSWSQTNGTSGTATCYPSAKMSWFSTWDSKFSSVLGASWVRLEDCGLLSNDTSDAYFSTASNVLDFPLWTRTNLFLRFGIGSGTNGGGLFTHTPELLTNEWVLGAVRKTTNSTTSWEYKRESSITTTVYDASIRPVFEYWPSCPTNATLAATFGGTSITFRISGQVYDVPSQTRSNAIETIVISDSNDVASALMWFTVTNITSTSTTINAHDSWRIMYKDSFPMYGGNAYRLYACDINERQAAIDPLVCTRHQLSISYQTTNWLWHGQGLNKGTWADAKTTAESTWGQSSVNDDEARQYKVFCGTYGFKLETYYARTRADRTDGFDWSVPSTMTNTPYLATPYVRLTGCYFVFVGGNSWRAYPSPEGSTSMVYDTFGKYTNMPEWRLHSWASSAIVTGNLIRSPGWEIGHSNELTTITTPWCDEPIGLGTDQSTRGYQFETSYQPSFWVQAMHTNWMTKY